MFYKVYYCTYHFRKRKVYMGDFSEFSDIESPNSRLKFWNACKALCDNQKKKIKLLENEIHNLKNKLKTVNSLVDHLQNEKKLISNNCISILKVCFVYLHPYIYVLAIHVEHKTNYIK